jgi:hypothetical protein
MRPVLHERLFPPAAAPLFAVLAKTNRRIYQEHRFTLSENENRNLGKRDGGGMGGGVRREIIRKEVEGLGRGREGSERGRCGVGEYMEGKF